MTHAEPDHAPHQHAAVPPWRNVRVLRLVLQVVVLLGTAAVIGFLARNVADAMSARGLSFGYGFLDQRAGFEIGESPIHYDADASYGQAFLVGLLNTLFVSVLGIVLATVLGVVVGVARLSPNWLVNRAAASYVEIIRNTPLLVQLFLIYFVVLVQLPAVRDTINLPGSMFLNQRGLFVPGPQPGPSFAIWLVLLAVGLAAAVAWTGDRGAQGGHRRPWLPAGDGRPAALHRPGHCRLGRAWRSATDL